jgi:nicotinamidase-related amidase
MTTEDLVALVEAALSALAAADQPVTFTAVAQQAGLARATLYRTPTLRALVEDHRLHQIDTRTLSGLSTEIGHLRTALEAIAERVRGHEERIRQLEHRRATRSS